MDNTYNSTNMITTLLDGSIEAEIITFLQKKERPFCVFAFSTLSIEYFKVTPLPELKLGPRGPSYQKLCFCLLHNGTSVN